MKKLLVGLMLLCGTAYSACVGPFCWDDTGASIGGNAYNGNGVTIPNASSTTIAGLTARQVGQTIVCNSCANVSGSYALCIATATTGGPNGSFIVSGSTNGVTVCK